jgi:hypothetical protein
MRLPGPSGENSSVGTDDDHRKAGLGDHYPNLVKSSAGGESSKSYRNRAKSGGGQASGHSDHVLLRDPYLEERFRKVISKHVRPCRITQVAVKDDDATISHPKLN